MNIEDLKKMVLDIVVNASMLSEKHTQERGVPVNYACIFSQNKTEYQELTSQAQQLGTMVQETAMGPVFHIAPLVTTAGELRLLKIRQPDPHKLEQGDADFTVPDYKKFKDTYLGRPGFKLIQREKMEMVELADPSFKVLAYYSHPSLRLARKGKSRSIPAVPTAHLGNRASAANLVCLVGMRTVLTLPLRTNLSRHQRHHCPGVPSLSVPVINSLKPSLAICIWFASLPTTLTSMF